MDQKQKAGFTKTGFSKSGFAACGHWEECQLGEFSCHYEEIDPEVMNYCLAYKRNHSNDANDDNDGIVKSFYDVDGEIANTSEQKEEIEDMEQLRLF